MNHPASQIATPTRACRGLYSTKNRNHISTAINSHKMKIASPQRNHNQYSYPPYYTNVICVALSQLNDRLRAPRSGYLADFSGERYGGRGLGKKVSTFCGDVGPKGKFNSAGGDASEKNPVEG
jgi:hypothetical protein